MPNPALASLHERMIVNEHLSQMRFRQLFPLEAYKRRDMHYYLNLLFDVTPSITLVPCRKCPACLRRRAKEWKGRLTREIRYWLEQNKRVLFVTLTYKDSYLKYRELYPKHINAMMDKMYNTYGRSFRYFFIPELGEKKGRPHLHGLIFDCPEEFAPDAHCRVKYTDKSISYIEGQSMLMKRFFWPYGINMVSFVVSTATAHYVTGYMTKNEDYSVKHNDGKIFKGNICCSNGLGFLDCDEREVARVLAQVRTGSPGALSYKIGEFSYPYPQSWILKHVPELERYYSSFTSYIRNYARGKFIFNKKYYKTYEEYSKVVEVALRGTRYYNSIFKRYSYQVVSQALEHSLYEQFLTILTYF